MLTLYGCQAYKQAKWAAIRKLTQHLPADAWQLQRLQAYLLHKSGEKAVKEIFRNALKKKEQEAEQARAREERRKTKKKSPAVSRWKRFKNDLNQFLPSLVMWVTRVLLFFQCYMYHKALSLFHLLYVLLTLILPSRASFFLSIIVMVPIYTFEFVIVYGRNIPVLT